MPICKRRTGRTKEWPRLGGRYGGRAGEFFGGPCRQRRKKSRSAGRREAGRVVVVVVAVVVRRRMRRRGQSTRKTPWTRREKRKRHSPPVIQKGRGNQGLFKCFPSCLWWMSNKQRLQLGGRCATTVKDRNTECYTQTYRYSIYS